MDRELTHNEKRGQKLKPFLYLISILAILYFGWMGASKLLQKSGEAKDLHIIQVERGTIRQTLTANGTVIPYSERVINAPVKTELEKIFLTAGTSVSKGDLILKLDQEYTNLEYERLQDELALRKNNIDRLKLQYDKDLRDIDYQDQIKALQLDELKAQLEDQKRLNIIGGATKEEVEAAQMKLQIAEIEKKVLENELGFRKSVNTTDKDNLQLEYNIQAKRLKELRTKLSETEVRSPQKGVVTWINEDIGSTVNEGDPLVKIANLDRFKIEANTSDRNNEKLLVGLEVEVRIGKEKLKGTISRILPEIINNTVRFYVNLEQEDHEALRPNLKTEILIITGQKEDVLRAKRGTGLKGTSTQFLYKVVKNEAIKVKVTKGLVSSDYFEIKDGLKEGDKIIVSETKDFDNMESFPIVQ